EGVCRALTASPQASSPLPVYGERVRVRGRRHHGGEGNRYHGGEGRFIWNFRRHLMHAYRGPRPTARKFANLELAGITGDGIFSGYASVFGEVDLGKDRIERGAFLNSLVERGARGVRM